MGRKNRHAPPGQPCHVVNRGNDRKAVFEESCDYGEFLERLATTTRSLAVRVYGYCLMPNHFHLLVEPAAEHALSAFMKDLTGGYACYIRRRTNTVGHGHVFQRRFWNAVADDEEAFYAFLRYIEANPVRSGLVQAADLWPWSSFAERGRGSRVILSPLPVLLPRDWNLLVNQVQPRSQLQSIRRKLVPTPGRPAKSDAV